MCELSARLVAWLDGELLDSEATDVERHLNTCHECRKRIEKYTKVRGMLGAYCDATLAAKEPKHGALGWAPVLGAAAALAVLFLVFSHRSGEHLPGVASNAPAVSASEVVAPAASSPLAAPLATRKPRKRTLSVSVRPEVESQGSWQSAAPALEIDIPGEAVFPPGALPPGVDFVADVSIATDGSAQQLRLRPQLTRFEEGPSQ
jgi:anti-sigma factor RsiW